MSLFLVLVAAAALAACSAPISTVSSPVHPRVLEIRNTTGDELTLLVLPVADGRLRAPTTFRGVLRPGARIVLHLYEGFEYRLVSQPPAGGHALETRIAVQRDLSLNFTGAAFVSAEPSVEVGEPRSVQFRDARDQVRALRGRPDRRTARTVETGFEGRYAAPALEVWTYHDTGYRYVFLDEFRTGRYVLLMSTDPEQPGRANWEENLPGASADELLRD